LDFSVEAKIAIQSSQPTHSGRPKVEPVAGHFTQRKEPQNMEDLRPHKWRVVDRDDYSRTSRMAVPGGWLYRTEIWGGDEAAMALVFVPDDSVNNRLALAAAPPSGEG
jgi:hypothetical protein